MQLRLRAMLIVAKDVKRYHLAVRVWCKAEWVKTME